MVVEKYFKKLFQNIVLCMFENAKKDAEIQEIFTEFDSEMDSDLKILKKELNKAGVDTVVSKDGAIALAAGIVIGTQSFGLGAGATVAIELRALHNKRQEVFNEHWT